MNDKREELIQRLDEARAVLQALLADIPPEIEIFPGWTLRQVYAHLTGWDDVVTSSLRDHAVGKIPATPVVNGINAYNAESVATRETLDYDHIVKEWRLARAQLKDALRNFPPDRLNEPLLFPWGHTGSVSELIHIFVEHEGEEHATELRAWHAAHTAS
jgi:uncharacterized protein (TIGR03083 family)